jgi:hypothetical protein
MKLKKNQSFTIVPKTKIINQVKKDQNENPLKSEDNGQHEFQGDEREKRGKKNADDGKLCHHRLYALF